MRRPYLLAVGCLCACTMLVIACGSSGRDLREPLPGAAGPTRSVSTTVAGAPVLGGSIAQSELSLTTTAWVPGGDIPAQYSCSGPSPELIWSGIPAGTTELALVVVDPDAGGFVHWLVTGISPTSGSVDTGEVPAGATQHPNSAGSASWFGPCPPPGPAHTYNFTLLALAQPFTVAPNMPPKDVVANLQRSARANQSVLTGMFQAGGTTSTAP